jgi:ubiquinone/menaquinone biosynthesis C-methylase UbiE
MEDNHLPAESEEIQRDKVKDLFDDRADLYFKEREKEHAFVIQKNCVLRMFDKDGGKVLDIGCGPAVMTDDLLRRGCTVCGIDVSEKMIDLALAKMENHDLRQNACFSVGDIENLEFPDGHFDAVICMGVLEYLLDDRPAISEMSRVLKPGGIAIITTPS